MLEPWCDRVPGEVEIDKGQRLLLKVLVKMSPYSSLLGMYWNSAYNTQVIVL